MATDLGGRLAVQDRLHLRALGHLARHRGRLVQHAAAAAAAAAGFRIRLHLDDPDSETGMTGPEAGRLLATLHGIQEFMVGASRL